MVEPIWTAYVAAARCNIAVGEAAACRNQGLCKKHSNKIAVWIMSKNQHLQQQCLIEQAQIPENRQAVMLSPHPQLLHIQSSLAILHLQSIYYPIMSLDNNILINCANKIKWILLKSKFEQEVHDHTSHILDAHLHIHLYHMLYHAQVQYVDTIRSICKAATLQHKKDTAIHKAEVAKQECSEAAQHLMETKLDSPHDGSPR